VHIYRLVARLTERNHRRYQRRVEPSSELVIALENEICREKNYLKSASLGSDYKKAVVALRNGEAIDIF